MAGAGGEAGGATGSQQGAVRAPSRDLRQLRRLAGYLAPYRWRVAATLVALAFAAASVLVFGVGLRYLIDGAFGAGRPAALNHGLKASLIVIAVLAAATFARAYLVAWLGERLVADLRAEVYAHVTGLSPGFFELTRTGEVLARLTSDTAVIQSVISASLSQALRNLLLLIGGLALLLVTNPKLTGLILIVVPLVVVPIVVIGRRVRRLSRLAQDRIGALGGQAEETLNAIRTVQAFAQEDCERRRFRDRVEQAFDATIGHARARAGMAAWVITLVFGAIVVVLWIGGRDVLAGQITGGQLAAFVFYASVVASAAGALSEIMGDLQRAAGATERLFELLDTKAEITAPAMPVALPSPARGALRFEHLSFAYPAHPEQPVLRDLDVAVAPGETVALVGPSGAGKTSVFQLLLRFYDPSAGRVCFDGLDLRTLDPAALRARIGLVPQEPVIFSANAKGQHPLRPARGERRRGPRRGPGGGGERVHRAPARRLRELLRREGRASVRRPAPADRDRPGDPARARAAPARRGDQLARRRERAPGPGGARAAAARPDHPGHRPSPGDRAQGRPHPGDGPGPAGRDRHPPRADRAGRSLRPPGRAPVRHQVAASPRPSEELGK